MAQNSSMLSIIRATSIDESLIPVMVLKYSHSLTAMTEDTIYACHFRPPEIVSNCNTRLSSSQSRYMILLKLYTRTEIIYWDRRYSGCVTVSNDVAFHASYRYKSLLTLHTNYWRKNPPCTGSSTVYLLLANSISCNMTTSRCSMTHGYDDSILFDSTGGIWKIRTHNVNSEACGKDKFDYMRLMSQWQPLSLYYYSNLIWRHHYVEIIENTAYFHPVPI